ncbi:hypothetical protein BV22DRAFT_1073245 [Leucogyrophana mollusca]|uniref:Uncharacterized protein n=1 Tax=Leucogyrophana mollusca TaxID=85980 RepID=A0ACB8B7I6_9AGAM|nr:hypothetical protein BV22DRAFT_1073245 [Leucogyrophana mollusca]
MQSIASSTLAVITRPPEIIACLKLATFATDVFVIFDSHPRPDHPGGAALILNTSIAHTATRLASILPVDNRMLSEEDLQWQAQLLANFSAHIFVPKNPDTSPEGMTQAVVESSLEVLSLQAEVAELKRKSSALASDNQRLEKGAEQLEDALVEGQRKKNDLQHKIDLEAKFSQKGSNRPGIVNAVAGPSGLPYNHSGTLDSEAGQGPSDCWPCLPPPQHLMRAPHNRQQADDAAPAEPMQLDPIGADESAKLAFRLQCDFDREDSSLRLQMEQLAKTSQSLFQCGICFEEQPEDFVIRLEACGHPFCRPCARSYIAGKLDEHRFPILCPTCSAEKCQNDPGAVTGLLLQQIGITEHQFAVWLEMEMVRFSVLLHCRGCKRSAFVDRQDHDATLTLACPLPNCDYVWCKACQRSITTGGPEHSCDGSSELDHLMKQSGWKYCPSCRTPIQKAMGCNHMTCISPGCNTHFCYRCGEGIVRSALQKDIKSAISAHFQRCRLFEDVPDHGVPP